MTDPTRKMINLPHKVCDYTCMVNGLEDLFEHQTGERLPDFLLFFLSGMACFYHIRDNRSDIPEMVFWGSSAPRQYQVLSEIMNFSFEKTENRSFEYSLKKVKQSVANGSALILGAVDMYDLSYMKKFYHRMHIPIHYFMVVGYDDENQLVYVHDCSRPNVQELSYADLQAAWNVNVPGLTKPNTFFRFEFGEAVSINQLIRTGLKNRCEFMLNPPTKRFGLQGMKSLADEIIEWKSQLSSRAYKRSLAHFVEYTGNPPNTPARMIPGMKKEIFKHDGGRSAFADLLDVLQRDYDCKYLVGLSDLFRQSGNYIQQINDILVSILLREPDQMERVPEMLRKTARLERQAYKEIQGNLL